MGINDLNRLLRKQEMEDGNNFDDTGLTQQEQDVETQLLAQEQNREIPVMMQGVDYTERPEREPILDRDAMFKSQAAVDEGINAPGVVESGETSQEEFDKLRGNILADAQKPAAEPPKSKEQLILEQLQKMRQDSDEELKSAKSRDRWLSLANSLNNALSRFDQASVLKATRTPGMQAIAPGVLAPTSSAKEVLAERQAKINELIQEQKLMAALRPKSTSKLDEAKIKEMEAKTKLYESKASPAGGKPSEGEKTLDREFAKKYGEWNASGQSQYNKNIKRLEDSLQALEKADKAIVEVMSGRAVGRLPNILRTNESLRVEQDVRAAAQGALKSTLGSQFTEKEGERIMDMAYDPKLPPSENIRKVKLAMQEIQDNAKSMNQQAEYFRKNKSLSGFSPSETTTEKSEYQGIQKDSKIEQYAKQYNMDYKQAEQILKARGYNAE
jgi:hypothetical protein